MLFKSEKDWKQLLPPEDEERLNEILKRAARNRGAYRNADEVKTAQLWCAILEIYRQNLVLQRRLDEYSEIFDCITAKLKKKCETKKELLDSLDRF